jgi:hypothetical protein
MITTVPIPDRMRLLPVDRRGYPVPVIIQRSDAGEPLFAANDTTVQRRCAAKKLCPVCGTKLEKGLWFCGGPKSAFHPMGRYFDSALHHECMTYALKVCPYLAMPNFRSTLELQVPHLQKKTSAQLQSMTMEPGRPKVFVAVMTFGQSVTKGDNKVFLAPLRPYHAVEFWRNGEKLDFEEGVRVAKAVVRRSGVSESDVDAALRLVQR